MTRGSAENSNDFIQNLFAPAEKMAILVLLHRPANEDRGIQNESQKLLRVILVQLYRIYFFSREITRYVPLQHFLDHPIRQSADLRCWEVNDLPISQSSLVNLLSQSKLARWHLAVEASVEVCCCLWLLFLFGIVENQSFLVQTDVSLLEASSFLFSFERPKGLKVKLVVTD